MKLVQYNELLISILANDGLVLQHQGFSRRSAEYTLMRFQSFVG